MQMSFNNSSTSALSALRRIALVSGFALVSCVAAAADGPSQTETKITVTPAVAGANTARTIIVSGTWPHACPPVGSSIEKDALRPGTVTFKLNIPMTLVACAQVLTPFEQRQTYTPAKDGVERVLAITNDGQFLAEGQLITQGQGKAHSMRDLSGFWYDPTTVGSGVNLIHGFATSDAMMGLWFYYDNAGKARWGSIQKGRWETPSVFVGELLDIESSGGACPQYACPQVANKYNFVATIRIEVNADGTLKVEALGPSLPIAMLPPTNVLFRSNVQRLDL